MNPAGGENRVVREASLAGQIDGVCDAFEDAWKRGQTPQLEDFLTPLPEIALRQAFRELLELELAYRVRAGEMPLAADYRPRFGRFAGEIDEAFERTVLMVRSGDTLPREKPVPPQVGAKGVAVGTPTSSGKRFRVLRALAKGGLGEVLVAEDSELNREVALKQIQTSYADDVDSRTRFVLEAEVTGRLEHPGIVPVYGLGTYPDGRPFYAMRLIQGISLKEAIDRFHAIRTTKRNRGEQSLRLRKLLGRFVDMCEAIEYAHSRGILHRDLKPANVMLGNYGETLVVDWGLAKALGAKESPSTSGDDKPLRPKAVGESAPTEMGRIFGTPQYMSPEQAAGRPDLVGPHSDIYGLGATLYCLLTGCSPLGSEALDFHVAIDRVERGAIAPPRQVNSQVANPLEAICLKAMALKPADRYRSAQALADDIEHWLADEPTAALPDSAMQSTVRFVRRHRAWALATVAALLIVSVVSLAALALIERQRQIANQLAVQEQAAFRQARDAVDDLFTKVSEDTLLNQPGMQGLRKELLAKTLDYYQRFLAQRIEDTAIKDEYAATLFKAGRIVDELESPEKSLPYFEQAREIQEQLLNKSPSDPQKLRALGDTYNATGRVLMRSQKLEAALDAYQKAIGLRQKLVELVPQDKEYQRALANIQMNIGLVETQNGKLDAAAKRYQSAQEIREAQLADGSDLPKVERDLAMGFYNLGLLEIQRAHRELAANHFAAAAKRFAQLEERDPRDLSIQYLLATSYRKSGDLENSPDGRHEESARLYQLARGGFARLVDRNPDVSEYQSGLAGTYMNLGYLASQQDTSTALGDLEKAQAILMELTKKYPSNPQFRRDLAVTWLSLAETQSRMGQHESAQKNFRASVEALTKLVEEFPGNADYAAELTASQSAWQKAVDDSAGQAL